MSCPLRLIGATAALLALLVLGACSQDADHPELALQRADNGSLVVHYAGCGSVPEQIRLVEVWSGLERELVVAGRDELATDGDEPSTILVSRRALPPRIRVEVEGDGGFTNTFDPDDVPPVEWQVLVPAAAPGEEIVDTDVFTARCST